MLNYSFTIDPGDYKSLNPETIRGAMMRAVERAAIDIRNKAVVNVTGRFLRRDTGALAASINYSLHPDTISAEVGSNLPYARFQELGVGHTWVIKPKFAKALHWKSGGGDVFATRVVHPGLRPRPWLRAALLEAGPDFLSYIKGELDASLKRGGGGSA